MKCVSCNHELVNIIYGKPTERLVEIARGEEIALGGLKTGIDRPKLYCYGCQESY